MQAIESLGSQTRVNILTSQEGKEFLRGIFHSKAVRIYGRKSYWAKAVIAYTSRSSFMIKVDDDIYMSKESWLTFFSEVSKLEDFDICSPVISSGIPSVELFLDNYCTVSEARSVRARFERVEFPKSLWGVDYSSLNGQYKIGPSQFRNSVSALSTVFKGIHPARIDSESQRMLLDLAFEALDRGRVKNETSIEKSDTYFCNNIFGIRRQAAWGLLIGTLLGRFRFDGYDELAVNGLLSSKKASNVVVLDCLAVHPSFNSAKNFQELKEEMFARVGRAV